MQFAGMNRAKCLQCAGTKCITCFRVCPNLASVLSPRTAAKATFALKAGVWFRRGRFVMVSPVRHTSWPLSGRNSTYPTVQISKASSLVWKNMLMHPVNGLFAFFSRSLGLPAIDFFGSFPLTSIILIVAWQWLPFALLILLTAVQSLDNEQKEAARMDGAGPVSMFFFIILPHLGRAISVVIMIETIFLLSVFAEIYVTTSGGPGLASTNLAFLIYLKALREYDVGGASAGGVIAVILANIVAVFLVRSIAKNITD